MLTLSYKIYCLELSRTKKDRLKEMINEYAGVYNYASRFVPSLPEKYLAHANPSKLYTKWVKSGIIERKYLGSMETFNAIKDACANFKTSKTRNSIETPNIIKFENSRYTVLKVGDHYGIKVGSKKDGIFLPLRVGKNQSLIFHLESILKTNTNPGLITYNYRDNSVSLPRKERSDHKFVKKKEILTVIGVDRGVNNHVVLCAVEKNTKKILGIEIVSGMEDKDRMRHLKKIADKRRQNRKDVGSRIHNIQETNAHRISRKIVTFAVQYPSPVVFFEDLGSMKKKRLRNKHGGTSGKGHRRMVASWNYYSLRSKTEYKLKLKGIWTMDIKAYMTSQLCHKCGALGTRDGIHFHCVSCGLGCGSIPHSTIGQYNSDVNASINIALRGYHVLYGRDKGSVAEPINQPEEPVMNPIPTDMIGTDGINSRKSVVIAHETTASEDANRINVRGSG